MPRAAVLLLAVPLLAGCLAGDDGASEEPAPASGPGRWPSALTPPAPDFDFRTVVDPDHGGHEVPDLHTAGHGLELVGHAGVQDILPPGTRGSITSIDVWGDYAVVAGMEGGLAFVILDISDPTDPRAIGWAPSTAVGWTARFSSDGRYVFYGCQNVATESAPNTGQVIGTCEDPTAVHLPNLGSTTPLAQTNNPMGISAWDVTDKTDPRQVDFIEVPGAHNIYVQAIDGVDYVFTSATVVLRWDATGQALAKVAELPGRHDVTVVQHPITGDWLLFTGQPGNANTVAVWLVNDPAAPEQVYESEEDDGFVGWHDQVLVPRVVDGRVILLLAGESSCNFPVSLPAGCGRANGERLPDIVSVVDVTNPVQPVLLSQWQPPFATSIPWNGYLWSVHEMAATPQGQVVISWYHAGVWVLDVSTRERQEDPVTLAAYQPHEPMNVVPSTFVQTPVPYVPFVWSAAWTADGHVIVPDMHTGVYVLEPAWGLHPMIDGGQ